jgi:hypothetical protein
MDKPIIITIKFNWFKRMLYKWRYGKSVLKGIVWEYADMERINKLMECIRKSQVPEYPESPRKDV